MQIRGRKGYPDATPQSKASMTSSGLMRNEKPLQVEGMDGELRAKIISVFTGFFITPLQTCQPPVAEEEQFLYINHHLFLVNMDSLIDGLMNDFIKKPTIVFMRQGEWNYSAIFGELATTIQAGDWQDVYYLLQLIVKHYPNRTISTAFTAEINRVLDEENAAYNFVAGRIMPKLSKVEMDEVEKATSGSDEASLLMNKAVDKLVGDPKNAIKEAVLALETLSNLLSEQPHSTTMKKTLPKVLARIEKALGEKYSPDLREAFQKLYDYSSSEPGVRHGTKNLPTFAEEVEARFIVVVCSTFFNYLQAKADEAGIALGTD